MSDLQDPRVLFAAERTLLAWNRTSLGLIAFGFVIERSGFLLQVLGDVTAAPATFSPAFFLGMLFILFGGLCAVLSAYQFSSVLKTLNDKEIPEGYKPRWGVVINIVVSLLSIALMIILFDMHR